MINTSLSYYNESLKHYFQAGIEQLEDMTTSHEEESIYSNAPSRSELLGLIQDLPDGYRFVFNMYVFEDFSHKEIASMLGISVNTSKSQLAKARRRLQKRLEEDYNMKPNIRSK